MEQARKELDGNQSELQGIPIRVGHGAGYPTLLLDL